MLKKTFLWLLLFYVAVAIYYYYEKVHRTMRTAIESCLFIKHFYNASIFGNRHFSNKIKF